MRIGTMLRPEVFGALEARTQARRPGCERPAVAGSRPSRPREAPAPKTPGRVAARSATDARRIARLRRICLALPGAAEKPSHGEPTWFAGKGRVFATLDDHHHRSEHLSVWLPLPFGAQETLLEREPGRFFRPPYVGGRGWVGVVLDGRPDWAEVTSLVREAYVQVAGRRLVARLGAPVRSAAPSLGVPRSTEEP
jgi:hypothetical protein